MTTQRSRGVALITAILVVAIATLAATAVLSASQVALHRTAALRDTEQAWWYGFGLEQWALRNMDGFLKNASHVGFDQPWSEPVTLPLGEGEGVACGQFDDAQGLFNLNNLRLHGAGIDYADQFRRLVGEVTGQVPPPELVEAVVDWVDANDVPLPMGAEDPEYRGQTPSYLAPNRELRLPSELLPVSGARPELREIYRALMTRCELRGAAHRCITALPLPPPQPGQPAAGTRINVNTAPVQVLRALAPNPSQTLEQFIGERDAGKPAKDINGDFIAKGYLGPTANAQVIGVTSDYFELHGDVSIGSGHVALYSLVQRKANSPLLVLSRSTVPDMPGMPPCATH